MYDISLWELWNSELKRWESNNLSKIHSTKSLNCESSGYPEEWEMQHTMSSFRAFSLTQAMQYSSKLSSYKSILQGHTCNFPKILCHFLLLCFAQTLPTSSSSSSSRINPITSSMKPFLTSVSRKDYSLWCSPVWSVQS